MENTDIPILTIEKEVDNSFSIIELIDINTY